MTTTSTSLLTWGSTAAGAPGFRPQRRRDDSTAGRSGRTRGARPNGPQRRSRVLRFSCGCPACPAQGPAESSSSPDDEQRGRRSVGPAPTRGPRTAGDPIARGDGAAGAPTGGVEGDDAAGHDDRHRRGGRRRRPERGTTGAPGERCTGRAGDAAGERRTRSHDDRHDRGGRETRSRGNARGRPRGTAVGPAAWIPADWGPVADGARPGAERLEQRGVLSVLHGSGIRVTFDQ